ncbi:glycosyltransferase family 4 protein [Allocoprobacillus halotolerans]|uniref:Glycosyltransferase family 4 protein n=1 Tax=Allocoprobacillus halotolerans TaxID=2944914 RepID=A0ABY5I2D5_9FIRM|nr:glycosyltransferase family 4 protein [Allocoprobacillus halotolerans]UTY38147.1 glycosyltransferase family 4 protein [Allocoprobacillus halotolerans]
MENKKVLFVAHVDSHIYAFHIPFLKMFHDNGYEVHVASHGDSIFEFCDVKHNLPFERNPFAPHNLKALRELKEIIDEYNFDIIHCHTPVGGVIARIANRMSKNYKNTKMIYTAHGFHFFKGAPLKNWTIYYPIEKLCAHYTDILITINKEDYKIAQKFKLKQDGKVEFVPGVGIDMDKINSIQGQKRKLCDSLQIPTNSILLLSVGELNENKNHKIVIECLPHLPDNFHYLICGIGNMKENYEQLAKQLQVSNRLHLLGYRHDILEIMKSCDIFLFPSKREGLSVALMEAKACGMVCIASRIRGNTDLIKHQKDGYILDLSTFQEDVINIVLKQCNNFPNIINNSLKSMEVYSLQTILKEMNKIYGLEF